MDDPHLTDDACPEMTQRVARAMAAAEDLDYEDEKARFDLLALAAMAAMRTPSRRMVDKGWKMIGSNLRYDEVYGHMVDAALPKKMRRGF